MRFCATAKSEFSTMLPSRVVSGERSDVGNFVLSTLPSLTKSTRCSDALPTERRKIDSKSDLE